MEVRPSGRYEGRSYRRRLTIGQSNQHHRASGITRSGRVFALPGLPTQLANAKGKAKVTEGQNVKVIPTPDEEVPTEEFTEGREGCSKKEVSL